MSARQGRRWDARYSEPGYAFGTAPSRFLVEHRALLPPRGRALDLAAGEGKDGVYLAEQGLTVRAVDISAVGLDKARRLADQRGVPLLTERRDLQREGLPPGTFEVIICMHYNQRGLAAGITAGLCPGGLLLMELNTVDNLALHERPRRELLLEKNELKTWFPALEIVKYQEGIYEGHGVAQLVARRGPREPRGRE